MRNSSGVKLTSYQGTLVATVYDKPRMQDIQKNDPWTVPRLFKLQKSIIYQGEASITNGEFRFAFIVPKDIDYQYGQGKISCMPITTRMTVPVIPISSS